MKKLPRPDFFDQKNASILQFYESHKKTLSDINSRKEFLESQTKIIQVKDLTKFYPVSKNFWGKTTAYLKAVDHLNFDIRKSETLGLVGESGCGKSTLSKAILRLEDADSGDVLFKNQSLYSMEFSALRRIRKDIQYIFQDPFSSLNPRLTVGYAIQEPMKVHDIRKTKSERKDRVIELLELVGLEADHYKRYPHQFSGGQRQRICIARALGLEPSFIVCDEIVSALDVSVQAQILNLLIDLRDQFDLSLLFVSHDLSIVKFISDRVLVMKDGKIVERGWADEIYANPKHNYTQSLLEAIPGKR